jgi:group I intron endonuclease
MIGIYKITSPSNRIYIGQSINIERRFKFYKMLKCKKQIRLYNSFLKYGIDNHKFEIICECDIKELNDKERYYQDLYLVLENGLNCLLTKSSNRSGIMSNKTKESMSLNHTKYWLNKKHSKLTISKISESQKTKYKNGFKPKRNTFGKKNSQARSVLDLNTGVFYDTIKEASYFMGFSKNSINDVLLGKVKKSIIKVI